MVEPGSRHGADRGQAIPVLLMVVALVAVMAIGVAEWGVRLSARERAATAADAAALAGVVHGIDAARALASLNGATLVEWRWQPGSSSAMGRVLTVEVVVSTPTGGVRAQARASTRP